MATLLYYDNKPILSGQPTPLVSREDSMVRYGERWANQSTIKLQGQITGCINDFDSLILNQQRLIDIFSRDFQVFKILEGEGGLEEADVIMLQNNGFLLLQDGGFLSLQGNSGISNGVIYYKPNCVVKNGIVFQPSNYVGILNYSVDLECYEEDLFSGYFGVLEPRNSWSFEEQNDQRLVITHSLGARGFNTNSSMTNALQNAKDFVSSKTGSQLTSYPTFINLPSGATPCLKKVKENVNRMIGTYGLELTYEYDLYHNTPEILRYTTDFECNRANGISRVTVDGKYEGCQGQDLDSLRSGYKSLDIYGIAYETYNEATARTDLNSGYLSSGLVEDNYRKILSFNVAFDNFTGGNVFLDYRVNINSGDNDITTVEFDGTVSARGDAFTKWQRVSGYFNTGFSPYLLSNAEYLSFAGGSAPLLNPTPLSSGVTYNRFNSQISTNVSWSNKEIPVSGFSDFEYSISYTPALEKVVAKPLATDLLGPICDDRYYVVDLGYKNRVVFSINGNGNRDCGYTVAQSVANLKQYANQLFNSGCPQARVLLEQNQITTGTNNISFNFTWTAESDLNVITPRVSYNLIDNLAL